MHSAEGKKSLAEAQNDKKRAEVVLYIHTVTHNLKKVASRHGVPLVFAAPNKLAKLCPRITENHAQQLKTAKRSMHGRSRSVPLKWFSKYPSCEERDLIGRCVNYQAIGHALMVKNREGAH